MFEELQSELTLDAGDYVGGAATAERATDRLADSTEDLEDQSRSTAGGMGRAKDAITGVGLAAGAAATGGIAASVREVAQLDTEMADLQNTTSGGVVAGVEEELIGMAGELGRTTPELGKIASTAAEVGVEGEENILKFTESVSKISTVTGQTTEETTKYFARLADITDTPVSKIDNLGSSFLKLRKRTNLTGQELMDVSQDAAPMLSQLGMEAPEIMSLAGSMGEVYPSAEEAGEGMSSFAEAMIEPETVKEVAGALGMPVKAFKQQLRNDPTGMFTRLARTMDEGGTQGEALFKALGEEGSRSLTLMSDRLGSVEKNQRAANKAFRRGDTVQSEFNTKMNTATGQWDRFIGKLSKIGTRIGNVLLPVLTDLLRFLNRSATAFSRLNSATNGIAGVVTLIATAIGGFATAIAPLIPMLSSLLPSLSTLGTAFSLLTGPVGIAIAAIAGLAIAWQQNLFGIRDHTRTVLNVVQNIIGRVLSWISGQWDEHGSRIMTEARKTWNVIESLFNAGVAGARKAVAPFLNWLSTQWNRHGDEIMQVVEFAFGTIKGTIEAVLDAIATYVVVSLRFLRGDWEGMWNAMKNFHERTLNGILDFIRRWDLRGVLMGAVKAGERALENLVGDFKQSGKDLINAFIEGIQNKTNAVGNAVDDTVQKARDKLPGSDAKEGPLTDLTASGAALPETVAEGVTKNLNPLEHAAQAAATEAKPALAADTSGGGSRGGNGIVINVDARGSDNPSETKRRAKQGAASALNAYNIRR